MGEIEGEKTDILKKKSVNGGVRPGAGRPKGSMNKSTKDKKIAEQEMIQRIVNNVEKIINSQLTLAQGLSYLYRIDETGEGKEKRREHVLVEDPEEIKEYLDAEENGETLDSYYYISTKSPELRAIDSLLDRAFGKAKESLELSGEVDIYSNLTDEQKLERIRLNVAGNGKDTGKEGTDIPAGGDTPLSENGADTQAGGGVPEKSGGNKEGDNPPAERPPENN